MKKIILIISFILVGGFLSGAIYAIVYLPNGNIPEQASNGYATPQSSSKQITLADGSCQNITSSTNTQYFIPSKTAGEMASFTGALPSGISVNTCVTNYCTWRLANNCSSSCAFYGQQGILGSTGTWSGPQCTNSNSQCVVCMFDIDIGECGTASGAYFKTYPTSNHCVTGTKVDVDTIASDWTFNWSCLGNYSGLSTDDAICSANKCKNHFLYVSGQGTCTQQCIDRNPGCGYSNGTYTKDPGFPAVCDCT